MVVGEASIHNIMGGMEGTAGVRLHNHRRKLKQRFDIVKKLGQGTYGKVQLGINKETGQEVAIKTIKKAKIETEADLVRIRREIQIMSSVQHPNIIHIYEVFENREKMVLVMEYAAGGELYDYLSERKVLVEEEARRIFRQISTAVYYCHKHKICHRDLKLENILLDENGNAKIADFGLSNVFDERLLLNTFCGSPLYASPEIVKGTPYHGPEVDCWSLGVLLYTLVYGAMPFDGSNFKRLVKQISQGDYFEPKKPSPASPLIKDMLTVTPAKRASVEQICSHWWVNEGYCESCLEVAEDLANQTPVRLDLLLCLAPAPIGSDKLVVPKEDAEGAAASSSDQQSRTTSGVGSEVFSRSHSVGSLMEMDYPDAEKKIKDFVEEKSKKRSEKDAQKRKLEECASGETGPKRKEVEKEEKSKVKDEQDSAEIEGACANIDTKTNADQSQPGGDSEGAKLILKEDSMDVDLSLGDTSSCDVHASAVSKVSEDSSVKSSVVSSEKEKEPEVDATEEKPKAKPIKERKKSVKKKSESKAATVPTMDSTITKVEDTAASEVVVTTVMQEVVEPKQDVIEEQAKKPVADADSIPAETSTSETKVKTIKKKRKPESKSETDKPETTQTPSEVKPEAVTPTEPSQLSPDVNDKVCKGASADTNTTSTKPTSEPQEAGDEKPKTDSDVKKKVVRKSRGDLGKLGSSTETSGSSTPDTASPTRTTERRKSRVFETAERFNLQSQEVKSPTVEKPKKVFIPGIKVSDAKKAFEKKPVITIPGVKVSSARKAFEQPNEASSPAAKSDEKSSTSDEKKEAEKRTVPELKKDITGRVIFPEPAKTEVPVVQQSSENVDIKKKEVQQSNKKSKEENESVSEKKDTVKSSEKIEERSKENEEDLKLIPALQPTDKGVHEEAKIKKLIERETSENAMNKGTTEPKLPTPSSPNKAAKPPVPKLDGDKAKTKSNSNVSSPLSPLSPTDASKKPVKVKVSANETRVATMQVSSPETKFSFDELPASSKAKLGVKEKDVDTSVTVTLRPRSLSMTREAPSSQSGRREGSVENFKEDSEKSEVPKLEKKKKKTAVEITLNTSGSKSATLPRRTSKAEIQLNQPKETKPVFHTEVEHMIGNGKDAEPSLRSQRSEVAFPVAAASKEDIHRPSSFRSMSVEPSPKPKPAERIIPIQVEKNEDASSQASSVTRPPAGPSAQRQRSGRESLSRQSTQDSDTDSAISSGRGPEPIRKSPREFIIPIAVEGGGYVTPRANSVEPQEESVRSESWHHGSRFGQPKRMSSLLSESGASEDEGSLFSSPFSTLQRRESENHDDEAGRAIHMHRLRSSRPSRHPIEHSDSFSSAEEDDDDGFEILTAESLFSTLLSRVRSLTQRLNVEEGGRPGFPSSRLMGHVGGPSSGGFWTNLYGRQMEPLSRRLSESSHYSRSLSREDGAPWRRSVSRDASDVDSVYSESGNSTGALPRGSGLPHGNEDFDSDTASERSGNSFSYYTPSLARRIQRYHSRGPSQELHDIPDCVEKTSPSPTREHGLSSELEANVQRTLASRRLARALSLHAGSNDKSSPKNFRRQISAGESYPEKRDVHRLSNYGRSLTLDYIDPPSPNQNHSNNDCNYRREFPPQFTRQHSDLNETQLNSYRTLRENRRHSHIATDQLHEPRGEKLCDMSGQERRPYTIYGEFPSSHDYPHESQFSRNASRNSVASDTARNSTREKEAILNGESKVDTKIPKRQTDYISRRSGSIHSSGIPVPASKDESAKPTKRSEEKRPVSLRTRSSSLTRDAKLRESMPAALRPSNSFAESHDVQEGKKSHTRSQSRPKSIVGLTTHNEEINNIMKPSHLDVRNTPDRSVLSRFFKPNEDQKGDAERKAMAEKLTKEHEDDKANDQSATMEAKPRRKSRFLRPDFYETPREESVYAKEKDAQKAAEKAEKAKKEETLKNRFLHSIEKRLEKFRGEDTAGPKSRVDQAISSLKEKTSKPSEAITESSLLKRAVSANNCTRSQSCEVLQGGHPKAGKLGNKVNSVLGLFRKFEEAPQNEEKPPKKSVLSRLRRTQSVYAGSSSDSILQTEGNYRKEISKEEQAQFINSLPSEQFGNPSMENKEKKKSSLPIQNRKCEDAARIEMVAKDGSSKLPADRQVSRNSKTETGLNSVIGKDENCSAFINSKESNKVEESVPPSLPVSSDNIKKTLVRKNSKKCKVPKEESSLSRLEENAKISEPKPAVRPLSLELQKALLPLNMNSRSSERISVDSVLGTPSEDKSFNSSFQDEESVSQDEVRFAAVKKLDGIDSECLDESLVSPTEDSFDSWSVCSDSLDKDVSLADDESVSERIRRKSFYSRFNDMAMARKKSKSKKSSSRDSFDHQYSLPKKLYHHHDLVDDINYSSSGSSVAHKSTHHSHPQKSSSQDHEGNVQKATSYSKGDAEQQLYKKRSSTKNRTGINERLQNGNIDESGDSGSSSRKSSIISGTTDDLSDLLSSREFPVTRPMYWDRKRGISMDRRMSSTTCPSQSIPVHSPLNSHEDLPYRRSSCGHIEHSKSLSVPQGNLRYVPREMRDMSSTRITPKLSNPSSIIDGAGDSGIHRLRNYLGESNLGPVDTTLSARKFKRYHSYSPTDPTLNVGSWTPGTMYWPSRPGVDRPFSPIPTSPSLSRHYLPSNRC